MRLHPDELNGIINAISPFLRKMPAELRLFGSRVDDDQRGGDIDLLLLLKSKELANSLRINKHKIITQIYENIGEQKIDLKIATQEDILQDAFLSVIFPKSVIAHQWE